MLHPNRVVLVALAFVAAGACVYLAFQFTSIAVPALMRMSARPYVPLWVAIFIIIVATASRRGRRYLRKIPRS